MELEICDYIIIKIWSYRIVFSDVKSYHTLGDIRYTVGMSKSGDVKNRYVWHNFKDYAEKKLLVKPQTSQETLKSHILVIQKIKDEYRNKAAHKTPMDVVAAKDCIDYVVEIERKLGMMLDAYRY